MLKKYNFFIKENLNDFNFLDIFLKLTEYTIPAGKEDILEPFLKKLIPNLQKDSVGNYFVKIGNSKTLFTSHLDTYSKTMKRVNHVIDGNIIKTDGSTVLGGDNKNGVLILLYLIKNGVSGNYYFFIGEESIVNKTGCYGSISALKTYPNLFKNFDKAIAFDRRGKGSLVRRQVGRWCASDDFVDKLIESYANEGLEFHKDNAFRTDSAVFMDIIPEIVNISSGGEFEHTFIETSDIEYVKKVAIASSKIDWDNLPIVRIPEKVPFISNSLLYSNEIIEKSKETFKKINNLMGAKGFVCLNREDFMPGVIMIYNKFLEDLEVKLIIIGDKIETVEGHRKIGRFRGGDFSEFERRQKLKIKNLSKGIIGYIAKEMNEDGELSIKNLNNILKDFNLSFDDFKNYILEDDNYSDFFTFLEDKIIMDIKATQFSSFKRQEEQEKTS